MSTKSTSEILAERGKTHGDFGANAEISEALMAVLARGPSYDLLTPTQVHALRMATHKMGRIVSGNPNEPDHWRDIAGYAELAADRIQPEHPELPLQSAPEIEEGLHHREWHNPANVDTPGDGYRFLLKHETPPFDAQYWDGVGWETRRGGNRGTPACNLTTYRTKAPLPNV